MTNFPGWVLVNISPVYSSLLSYASFGLMCLYFFLTKKWGFNLWMIVFGALYFGVGSINDQTYMPDQITYIIIIIKFFITIVAGYTVIKDTTRAELFSFLVIGAFSVFLQMFVFYNPLTDGGRYSGFYLNPNALGFICMMGYALSYGLDKKWRLIGHLSFTIIGFLTFSRTFIVVWLFMNLLSIRLSLRNIRVLVVGLGLLVGLLTYNAFLPKSNPRLEAMNNLLAGESDNTSKLQEDSRTATWAIYYPELFSRPILGHGYGAFGGGGKVSKVGPHNAYIKIWGEGGILPLVVIILLYGVLLKDSWGNFLQKPHLFLMIFALCLYLLTNHNYIESEYLLFFSMWLQYHIFNKKNEEFFLKGSNKLKAITIDN